MEMENKEKIERPEEVIELTKVVSEGPKKPRRFSLKRWWASRDKTDKTVIKIFGAIIIVLLLALWAIASYEVANKARAARQQVADLEKRAIKAENQWSVWQKRAEKAEESVVKANKMVEEAETKVKTAEEVKTECETKVKELETALAAKTKPVKSVAPVIPVTSAGPHVKVVSAKEIPEELKIAIVGKGEGIEHALIRQLIFVPELYGFKGDTGDKKAVKKWAQTKAHQIAILAGYVDAKTGNEVRVKGPGGTVAYVLQADSELKLSVVQSCKDKDGNFPDPGSKLVKTLELAKDFQSATFQGNVDVQTYEYLYFKVKGK